MSKVIEAARPHLANVLLARGCLAVLVVSMSMSCERSKTPHWSTLVPTSPLPPPSSPIAGEYAVTFTADSSCDHLPPAIRERTYIAKISGYEHSRSLEGELSGSDFFFRYNTFSVIPRPGAAKFRLVVDSPWTDELPIFERLASGGYIAISGNADALIDKSNAFVPTTFKGSFSYCAKSTEPSRPDFPPTCSTPIECTSEKHGLTLTRR